MTLYTHLMNWEEDSLRKKENDSDKVESHYPFPDSKLSSGRVVSGDRKVDYDD